jgi:hypothetical protein
MFVQLKTQLICIWFSFKFSGWIANATKNSIDVPSDLAVTSFDRAACAIQKSNDAPYDLAVN